MKDPIILCHICKMEGVHIRGKSGIRCPNPICGLHHEAIATEQDVQQLKQRLRGGTWHQLKQWVHDLQERDYGGGGK
jgi:hypothetical protein